MDPGFRTSQPERETGRRDPNTGGEPGHRDPYIVKLLRGGPTYLPPGADTLRGGPTYLPPGADTLRGGVQSTTRSGTTCRDLDPSGRQVAGTRTQVADRIQGSGPERQTGYRDILQVYRHPTGIQTSYRYTDIPQVYRHPTGIQTSNRYTDILQVYRHPASIQTSYRYTSILQVCRHPAGIRAS